MTTHLAKATAHPVELGRPARRHGLATVLRTAAGPAALVVVWQVLAMSVFAGSYALPSPVSVVREALVSAHDIGPNLAQTASEALFGWLWGNLAGVVAGVLFVLLKPLERIAFRLFVALYCLPLVAIAPILSAVLGGDQPQIVVSAQGVFFTTLIAVMLGARSADAASLDIVSAYGGGRWRQFATVRCFAALPSVFSGLRIAAPAAVLGAVVGEYLGGRRGLGVAMVYSQQSLDVPRTWALALYTTLLAAAGYLVTVLVERVAVPWMRHDPPTTVPVVPTSRGGVRQAVTTVVTGVASVVFLLVVWHVGVVASGLSAYFMKTPVDVWHYLVTDPDAAAQRSAVLSALGVTLRDALLGFAAGMAGAIVVAALVTASATVRAVAMPTAVAVRTVPLVALTPLFAVVFGRGTVTVLVVAGLVTLFPALVTIVDALAQTPRSWLDVVDSYGGSATCAITTVMLPNAVPAVFAASRIAAPTAILGALLVEWLATGTGLGSSMLRASADAQFSYLWSSVALITGCAFVLYALAASAEAVTVRRLHGPS